MAELNLDTFLAAQTPQRSAPGRELNLDSFLDAQKSAPLPSSTLPQPDEAIRIAQQTAQGIVAASMQPPPTPQPGPSLSALPAPSLLDRIKGVFMGDVRTGDTALGRATGHAVETVNSPTANEDPPLLRFESAAPEKGIVRGAAEFATGLTTPQNIELIAGTGGLAEGAPVLSKLLAAGFSVQQLRGVYQQVPEFRQAVHQGDWATARQVATKMILGTAAAVAGGHYALKDIGGHSGSEAHEAVPTANSTGSEPYRPPASTEPLNLDTFLQRQEATGEKPHAQTETHAGARPAGRAQSGEKPPVTVKTAESVPPSPDISSSQSEPISGTVETAPAPKKPLHEMSPDELDAVIKHESASDKEVIHELFGPDEGKRYSRLEMTANSSSDTKRADGAYAELEKMQATLTEKQRNRLFGIDEPDAYSLESARSIRGALGRIDPTTPQTLGDSLKWAVTKFDPENPTANPEAYAQLRHAAQIANENGWNTSEVMHAAYQGAADRFSDPEDAALMLDRFRNDTQASPEGLQPLTEQKPAEGTATPPEVEHNTNLQRSGAGKRGISAEASGNKSAPVHQVSRPPAVPASYGRDVNIAVPGETTIYPAKYSIRDASDIEPSHNPFSFETNPRYEHQNDRDYRNNTQLSALVAEHAGERFNPDFMTAESPTAEHGAPIIEKRGNVLGGNSRAMSLSRVYQSNPEGAASYRADLRERAASYGLNPSDLDRFQRPVLVRELSRDDIDPQKAITDFNKGGPAALSPAERAVADGRRLSQSTVNELAAKLEDVGDGSTLAQALRGDNGADAINRLVQDGIVTPQEKNGLLDERGNLTGEAKDRIARMLVGRLFDSPASFNATPPELRGKLERVAPQVLRVENRPEWNITPAVREAVNALAEARAHGFRDLDDLARQQSLTGEQQHYSPDAMAIAQTLRQNPLAAAQAFRRYANDETLSREDSQVSFFTPPTRAEAFADAFHVKPLARSAERGSMSAELLTLGANKFWQEDVAPAIANAAHSVADASDDILKILAPQLRSTSGKQAALILRGRLAELARRTDTAQASLREAKRAFDRLSPTENYQFIARVENGESQPTPELEAIARTFRAMLDGRRADIQALGTGKLRRFYENYFPHVWADPKRAAQVFAGFFKRGPLEGGKSFLKQRSLPTFEDGLAAGLKPVSDNPVDLVLMKIREQDKYLMAHQYLEDLKAAKLLRFVDAREGTIPGGWEKIRDDVGTVYGPSTQQITEYPNAGLWTGLQKVADALGIKHERGFLKMRGAVGRANQATGTVKTLHGSAEDVLAHEIGHQIDWLAGSGKKFVLEYPDAQTVARLKRAYATLKDTSASTLDERRSARTDLNSLKSAIADRKEFAKQLRDLADLRGGDKSYTHKREEKMAQLAEMWVGSRELFQRTAPKVFAKWKQFLDENPKLHALRDIEGNTEVTPISQPYDVGGLVIRGHWYAPEGAARILDNYLSPGLRERSSLFRGALGLNNTLNQFQLGISARHAIFTGIDAAVSKGALAIEMGLRGRPLDALKTAAQVPFAPFSTIVEGNKISREWYRPGSQGGQVAAIVDAMQKGGGRAQMDQMYQTKYIEGMMGAFRRGNLLGGLVRSPLAGLEAAAKPILEFTVPRMKMGAFADLARFELERMSPDAPVEQVRERMAQVWDSVENRMGEMTYDNLNFDRTAKDIAMLLTRSVGWNLGTIREVGGAGVDLVRIPVQLARGTAYADVNLHRLSYVASLAIISATMGAVYQRLVTGKGPEELKDYFFPKNGETDENGRPQRISFPTYDKDVYNYATDPGRTLANKASPLVSLTGEMVRNEDFYGTKIYNEDDPLVRQFLDSAKHIGESFEPIGIRNFLRETKLGAPLGQRIGQLGGYEPAPAALDEGPGERMARELAGAHSAPGGRTREQAERSDLRHELSRSLRAKKGVPADVLEARKQGKLSREDVADAVRASRKTPLQNAFNGLGIDEALRVYSAASREERKQLQPMLVKKAQAAIKDKPAAERAPLVQKLRAALAK